MQPSGPTNVMNYLGESFVPKDVLRRRRFNLQTMRRMGNPVVIRRMLTDRDVAEGYAEKAPGMQRAYGQTRHDDPISHGIGFVSLEKADNEWYNASTGTIVVSATSPGAGYVQAPAYRGFGPGYLTYMIQPDVAEDVFKLNEAGVLIEVQTATAQAPWFPEIQDNDIIINVVLDNKLNIVDTKERYQAKQTNPITMRGLQRKGRREAGEFGGNRFRIGTQFEMTLIPKSDQLYNVEVDR